jgi:hypothetical protein
MTAFAGSVVARWQDDNGKEVANLDNSGNLTIQGDITTRGSRVAQHEPRGYSVYFDDFLGDSIRAEHDAKLGSGTGNAAALTTGQGGRYLLTSASDDGADTANFTAIAVPNSLSYRADAGSLGIEARLFLSAATGVMVFVGFTDTLPSAGLVVPVFVNGSDVISGAANAVGIFFDTDGLTSTKWGAGGRKASASTASSFSSDGPTASTFDVVRAELDASGTLTAYVNERKFAVIANAVTITTPLVPVIYVGNRAAAARTATVDYVYVRQAR